MKRMAKAKAKAKAKKSVPKAKGTAPRVKKEAKRYAWAYPEWVGKIMRAIVNYDTPGNIAQARARGDHQYADMLEKDFKKIQKMK